MSALAKILLVRDTRATRLDSTKKLTRCPQFPSLYHGGCCPVVLWVCGAHAGPGYALMSRLSPSALVACGGEEGVRAGAREKKEGVSSEQCSAPHDTDSDKGKVRV